MSEVLNEYSAHTNSDEEGLHFREVFAGTPVNDFVHSRRVRDLAFWGANMHYNSNLSCSQQGLLTREGSPTILHSLDDAV